MSSCIKMRMIKNMIMSIKYIILFLSFSSISIANNVKLLSEIELGHESECGSVRMDLPPGVMSKIPVGDMSGVDNCWAYPSSSCLDAWRLKNETPVTALTAPLALSLEYANFRNLPNLTNAASAVDVLDNINSLNGCSTKSINDFMNNKTNHSFLNELRETYIGAEDSSAESVAGKVNACLQRVGIKEKMEVAEIATMLRSKNWIEYLNSVVKEVCKNSQIKYRNVPKPILTEAKNFGSASKATYEMKKVIDRRLNQTNPSPIGIAFCESMLKSRTHVTMSDDGSVKTTDKNSCPSGSHGGTIVGRRKVLFADENGAFKNENYICQYLVRDSRGSKCNGYPNNVKFQPSDKCVQGQIWVEEDILLTNTTESFYLEDKR